MTGPLVGVVADLVGVHDLDDDRLARPTRDARYETIAAVAEENLHAGMPVVLVAPFSRERRDLHAWEALDGRLRAAGGSPLLVWLHLERRPWSAGCGPGAPQRDLVQARGPGLVPGASSTRGRRLRGPHLVVNAEAARRGGHRGDPRGPAGRPRSPVDTARSPALAIDGTLPSCLGTKRLCHRWHSDRQGDDMSSDRSILRDVATTAGVSLRTASRVLNEDPRVAAATRERVHAS